MGPPNAWIRGNGNLLLAGLPRNEFELVSRHLEVIDLKPKVSLYDPNTVIEHVYFPTSGLVSMLGVFRDGTAVETLITGREGMVGMAVFHGTDRMAEQAVVQLPGQAERMKADAFRRCLAEAPRLREALNRYSVCMLTFVAQNVACVAKHTMPKRLARWLLHASDHTGTEESTLTHLYLSHMLGVRRSSVTLAAAGLRTKKLITYTRKHIKIADRDGLAAHSCECYGIVRHTYDRLMFGQTTANPFEDVESSRGGISILDSPHPNRDVARAER